MNAYEKERNLSTNIPIIQLQVIDENSGENTGGLYINPKHICSLVPEKYLAPDKGYTFRGTKINTVDGKSFMTPYTIMDVLQMIGHS